MIRVTYNISTANFIFNGEKQKALPQRSITKPKCPLLPIAFNIPLEIYSEQLSKENKGIWIGKEQIKLFLFGDDITLQKIRP